MIRRNKTILRLAAATLSLGIVTSIIPQAAFADEFRSVREATINKNDYLSAKDENGIEWKYYIKDDGTIAVDMDTIDLPETIKVPAKLDGYKVSHLISITKDVYRFSEEYSKMRENAKKVKSIIIPEGVTIIYGLGLCSNVKNISIPSSINITSRYSYPTEWLDSNIDSNGFVIKQGVLIDGSKANGNITIPTSVRVIADVAVEMNDNITSVTIPSSVKRIGIEGFFRCANLTKVTMNEGLEFIGEKAFAECYKLKEAVVPSTVTEMGDAVFYADRELESTTPDSSGLVIVDGVLMDGRGAKGDVVIPSGVTKIKAGSFWNNHNIKSLGIPSTVTEIEDRAFPSSSLEKVNIPGSVKVIPRDSFDGCFDLKEVIIEDGVETIDTAAFSMCSSLTKIDIPDSVTKIGLGAFRGCSKLVEVKYKDGIEVEDDAFYKTPWEDGVKEEIKVDEALGEQTSNTGWYKDKNGDWYYLNDDKTLKKGLFWESTDWNNTVFYHFDEETGKMTTGWIKLNDAWYHFDTNGKGSLGWIQDTDGKWYYFDQIGQMCCKGWYKTTEGKSYYFNEDGSTKKGWFKGTDGIWYHTDLIYGDITIGWFKDTNGKWYYFNKDGSRKSGWFKDTDGKWYHLKADGEMNVGWFKDTNGKWYYFNVNGSRRSGWVKDTDGKWYYLYADGEMATGWIQDTNGKWYYLYSNGSMACNTYIGSYYVGASGAWIR